MLSRPACIQDRSPLALEEHPLGLVGCVPDGAAILLVRVFIASETREEVGADGVEDVVAVERELLHERERDVRPVDLGDRDRAVERDDGLGAIASSWS